MVKKSEIIQNIGIEVLNKVKKYKQDNTIHPMSKQFWNDEEFALNDGKLWASEEIYNQLYNLLNNAWHDALKEEQDES